MQKFFLALSFVMTGILPFAFGLYLAQKEDYFIAIGCILTSVCGFQQVYHNLKNQELFEALGKQIIEKQVEIDSYQEELAKQRKEITRNLADFFGEKMQFQQRQLDEARRSIEQKNKEIWKLRDDYYH